MRILQVIPNLGVGGAERMVMHLSLYTRENTPHAMRVVSLYGRCGSDIESKLESGGVEVSYLGKHRGPHLAVLRRLQALIAVYDPDVIHSHLYSSRYLLPCLWAYKPRFWLHTVHSVSTRESDFWGRLINRHLYGKRVTAVAISPQLKDDVEKYYGISDVPMIMNGIPVDEFDRSDSAREAWRARNNLEADALVVVSVGRLTHEKNHLCLVRAFHALCRHCPKARLVLVGEGECRDKILEAAAKLDIGKAVILLGIRQDISEILRAADIFVSPSLVEGNPLSLMEAMASGRACVATRVGGVPDLVQDGATGLLIAANDTAGLAESLLGLTDDVRRRLQLGENARQYARLHFDIEEMTRSYLKLYREGSSRSGLSLN